MTSLLEQRKYDGVGAGPSLKPYELKTGTSGIVYFWGGLFAQVSVIVLLAGLANGSTAQPAGVVVLAFFLSMLFYFLIDVAWVFGVEIRMFNRMNEAYGYEVIGDPTRPLLLGVFFLFSATANTFVVILPALDEAGIGDVDYVTLALRSYLLGWFAYGNLALVQAWTYKNYPLDIVGTMPLSGGALSCFSSLLTAVICSRI